MKTAHLILICILCAALTCAALTGCEKPAPTPKPPNVTEYEVGFFVSGKEYSGTLTFADDVLTLRFDAPGVLRGAVAVTDGTRLDVTLGGIKMNFSGNEYVHSLASALYKSLKDPEKYGVIMQDGVPKSLTLPNKMTVNFTQ